MYKSRLPRLTISRASLRPLTTDLAHAAGARPRLVSCDPGIGGSHCDPMCVETSETGTTTLILSAIRC
jgi:hypothetical protein